LERNILNKSPEDLVLSVSLWHVYVPHNLIINLTTSMPTALQFRSSLDPSWHPPGSCFGGAPTYS